MQIERQCNNGRAAAQIRRLLPSGYSYVTLIKPESSNRRLFGTVRCRRLIFTAATLLLAAPHLWAADTPGKPRRIVSLNMCVDELVLRLADPRNIASVTWLSRDPTNSNVAELAAQIPVNHGLAEEIIPLKPDLVIAGIYTARPAVAMLKRVGIPVAEIDVPKSLDDVRRQIREVAALVGERDKGEAIIKKMDATLTSLPPPARAAWPRAIVLNPNGVTVGKGTLVDEVMRRAGLANVAAELTIDNYGQIPLETVVANAVDVLILSASRDGPPALATEILRHPVLAALADRTRVVVLPGRLWNCGGPTVVEAIERLARVADEVRGEAPAR
jgi:iron complex transport system substrate-binding protein